MNCTVTLNTGSGGGSFGGIGSFNAGTSITLKNTIVAGNPGAQAGGNGAITSLGNNISSDGTPNLNAAGDLPNTNPLLAPLGNYGGTMPTHGLLPGSPAINAGTSAGAPATDQRGIARPQLGLFDIGAFESQGFTLTIAGGNNQTTLVNTAFANLLSVNVTANGVGEPVNGGTVTFMPPMSGASASIAGNPATISGGLATTGTVTANGTGGTYSVMATSKGATPTINFSLTNNATPMFTACPTSQTVNATSGQCTASVSFNAAASGFPTPTVTCRIGPTTITSPHNFPVGTSNVVCTASNGVLPDANCSFSVTVNDTQLPTLGTCPANITNQVAGANCMAAVSFTPPTASDNCGTATVTCTPASGSSFPLGTTTVSCKATDLANNMSAPCTFTVQVLDTTAPTLNACPTNITAPNTTNQCSAVVTFTNPSATDNCGTPTVTCLPASGASFLVGITTVTCTASDASPDSSNSTCSFTVTVQDTQAPTLSTCPTNITVPNTTNQCSAVVSYTAPTATDNCGTPTVLCSPASGTLFNVGVTTVTCTASDASPDSPNTTCSFTITVQDTQAPAITCPANITISNTINQCSAVVTYTTPTPTDNCPGATASCTPASGSTFVVGVTTVTCTASDASPNSADTTCTFTVRVNDTQAPSLTCPANIFLASSGNPVVATWNPPTVSDNCSGVGAPICTPASGSSFNVGVTTVTCSVSDAANNPASCSFTVTVGSVRGSVGDPLACTGPGNTVSATLVISNNGQVNQTVADTTTFTNLVGVPGSCTVSPNVGTCTVTNGNLTYNATLTPGQTVTISYLTQVSDLAPTGAQVCTNNSVSFNAGSPLTLTVCDVVDCPGAGPGNLIPAASEASDQKAGSVLIYNVYTSGATSSNTQNTRINITNTHLTLPSYVHLFFVAEGCAVADSYICLTGNQTASFLASDLDPGTTGYLVAVAVNALGCPTNFNYLIGDEYVKFTSGHAANLAAEAFAALPGGLPACDANANTAALNFDGISYNRTPATLALDNIGSRADGNDTLLIVNRIGGNLGIGASSLGTLFGIFYDDAEAALSFSVTGGCQLRNSITNNFPRTTPRFETFIPAGRTGWLKVFNQTGAVGITGAAINFNPNAASSAGAFNQGHNLHHLTLNNQMSYIIPVFPPSC